jgi:hypothetical protein
MTSSAALPITPWVTRNVTTIPKARRRIPEPKANVACPLNSADVYHLWHDTLIEDVSQVLRTAVINSRRRDQGRALQHTVFECAFEL